MRVLLDTNVIISYLLHPNRKGAVEDILGAVGNRLVTLLVPAELLEEVVETVARKEHLAGAISARELGDFMQALQLLAEPISIIASPIPVITRDPKDDYLLAYTIIGEADYLVTGDQDLLSLELDLGVKIVEPRAFQEILKSSGLLKSK